MPRIHPLACVDDAATVHDSAEVGPFCVIGPHVVIGAECRLFSHVTVAGHTTLGAGTVIHPYASLGGPPQSVSYRGGPTRLVIGASCDIREGVTMNIGTEDGTGLTEVGDGVFCMAYSHVGHDCRVGNGVVLANGATLGGHCQVGDYVFMGGLSAAHQHARIGAHAMIGGLTGMRGDIIPFALASGSDAALFGINVRGLRRRGFSAETIGLLRRSYRTLFLEAGSLEARLDRVERDFGAEPAVAELLAFIRGGGKRPLCHAAKRRRGPE